MKAFRTYFTLLLLFVIGSLLTACSSDNSTESPTGSNESESLEVSDSKGGMPDEPIILQFMVPWNDEAFAEWIKKPVEDKFPNITMELVKGSVLQGSLEELFAKGIVPDMYNVHAGFKDLKEVESLLPLEDLIEKYDVDISNYREGSLDTIKERDPEGKGRILGLPVEEQIFVTFYNKDIFDLFGQSYPTDGMSWDEVIDLSAKVSGTKDGVRYQGLKIEGDAPLRQLSPQVYDADADEFMIARDSDLTRYFDLMRRVQGIPGNYEKDEDLNFNVSGQVAMMVSWISHANVGSQTEGLDFDMVTVPTWDNLPSIGTRSDPVTYSISPESDNIDAAFLVLKYLVSTEYQTYLSRIGRPSSLAEAAIHEQYGADKFGDKVYNVKSGWSLTPANPLKLTPETTDFMDYVGGKMGDLFESNDDTPTFLRKMEEEYANVVKEKREQQ